MTSNLDNTTCKAMLLKCFIFTLELTILVTVVMMLLYDIKVIQKYKTMLLKCSISTLELTMLARGHYGVALHHDLIMIFNIGFLGLKFKIFIGGIIPSWISVVIHSAVLVFC